MIPLSYQEGVMLDIAATAWVNTGVRDQAIKDRLGLTPPQYFVRLNAMLDDPNVEAAEPVTVHRLQRLREKRRLSR